MRKLPTLLGGIVLGFVLAHFVNQTAAGRNLFDSINRAAKEITDAVVAGYNEAE